MCFADGRLRFATAPRFVLEKVFRGHGCRQSRQQFSLGAPSTAPASRTESELVEAALQEIPNQPHGLWPPEAVPGPLSSARRSPPTRPFQFHQIHSHSE